nr:phage major capsid protein [Serinicoccus marinus]
MTYCRGTGTHLSNKANAALLGNAAAPAGMLNDAGITDGGALGDNLDALSAAVWGIAEAGANADYILAAPSAMADLAALKAGTGSNVPLMAEPVLYGLPVHVTNAMPADSILVGSTTAVVSAAGQVRVARSNDYAFNRDAVAIRVDFRSGWTVVHGNRLVRISTAA